MPHNATDMIHNARQEFDHLLDYFSEQAHPQATAYQVECDLFKQSQDRPAFGVFNPEPTLTTD